MAKALFYLFCICFGSVCLLFLLDRLSGWRSGALGATDCRPHLYLSGTVEIRGKPGVLYVLDYRDLQELVQMLQAVEADMNGKAKWLGTD